MRMRVHLETSDAKTPTCAVRKAVQETHGGVVDGEIQGPLGPYEPEQR